MTKHSPAALEMAREIAGMNNVNDIASIIDAGMAELVFAMRLFEMCDLNDGNCASFDVANKRIRSIARDALTKYAVPK